MSLLTVAGISKSYGGVRAVDGLAFQVDRGEIVALIGPNGAGKSTCFNLLNGQIRPDSGSIAFNGVEIVGRHPRQIWKLGVGRTFQVPEAYGSMTLCENVQMVLVSKHHSNLDPWRPLGGLYRDQAMAVLERVGIAAQAERSASVLAYGDVKRLELAVAIASDPILLLMDEPTAGMSPGERESLMQLTADLVRERNLAVLFTEHSMDVVFSYAQRILVMSAGRVIASGSPAEVREDPEVQKVYLGSAAVSGETKAALPRRTRADEQDLLRIENLNAFYGRGQILFDVSLSVRPGEVVALMGRNGAGKSTTFKAVMGHLEGTAGRITFRGQDIGRLPTHRIARLGLGYVPEDRRIFTGLTVMENLTVGERPKRSELPEWTPAALFRVFPNLAGMLHRPAGRMSGGEQQMLTTARTLMGNPLLIMLDEPSEGVSPIIVERMVHMINDLKQLGIAILLSEQNLGFASAVSDRAYVIEKGHIRFSGSMEELAANESVRRAYLTV